MKKKKIQELIHSEVKGLKNKENNSRIGIAMHKVSILKELRLLFTDLKLKNEADLPPQNDLEDYFVNLVLKAQNERRNFFRNLLIKINATLKTDYNMDSVILGDKDPESLEYFFDISKLYDSLRRDKVNGFDYVTSYVTMASCNTPRKLGELLYRRGRF